jgi:hypothetical protein
MKFSPMEIVFHTYGNIYLCYGNVIFCYGKVIKRLNLSILRAIAKARGQPGLIQGLNDLAVIGNDNPDMSLPDKAAHTADEMAALLAEVTASKAEYSKTKKIRDQAYTHLKAVVDEIREYGQYVFRQNKERFNGYRSYYVHLLNKKGSKVPRGPESVTAE